MSASNDPAEAQGERMIRLEDELESFLEATQDPAAWLMVFAAKDEIERLNRELKLAQAGWRKGDADEFLEATQNANNALEIKE